jgi:hypothetical protein
MTRTGTLSNCRLPKPGFLPKPSLTRNWPSSSANTVKGAGRNFFDQEYLCSFEAAILGAYWGKEMREADQAGRITTVERVPDLPVHTAWDLGMGDSTAIWCFQIAGSEIRVIDHIEAHGEPLAFYAQQLEARGYRGDDWVPHDAKVRELGTGRTRIETLISPQAPTAPRSRSWSDGRHQRRPRNAPAVLVRCRQNCRSRVGVLAAVPRRL